MKNIKITLLSLLLNFALLYGQTSGNPSYLPNVTPPSPQAFAITEYGKNTVNEYNGKVNLSVPIYNYTAGQLSLPISVNYSGAGVKVDDIATWTGINWTLLAGGVITRKINDSADELDPSHRAYINQKELLDNAYSTCSQKSQDYYKLCWQKDQWDTEIDVFSFSFNGYSGSFYLDEGFNPVMINDDSEIKVQIIGTESTNLGKLRGSKKFLITTPDGVRYYFGGAETEETMIIQNNFKNVVTKGNTSFYLNRVEHPINGTIILEYTTGSTFIPNLNISYVMTLPFAGINPFEYPKEPLVTYIKNRIDNPKTLSKIKSLDNSIEINFNSTDIPNNANFNTVLNSIEVKNGTTVLKKIDFTYGAKKKSNQASNNFTTTSRFFLTKIEINKDLGADSKREVYNMEYKDPFELPARLSTAQDILGYYNGQTTNRSLIPDNINFNPNHSDLFADRRPDFSLASKGALTKITYPTKGYSIFEYEPNPVKQKRDVYYSGHVTGREESSEIRNEKDSIIDFKPVYEDQDVEIKITTGTISDDLSNLRIYKGFSKLIVQLQITDLTTQEVHPPIFRALGMAPQQQPSQIFHFKKGSVYQIKLKIITDHVDTNNNDLNKLTAGYQMNLFDGYGIIGGFGVRVKKQRDYSSTTSSLEGTNIRRYFYGRLDKQPDLAYLAYHDKEPDLTYLGEIEYEPKYTLENGSYRSYTEGLEGPHYATEAESQNADIKLFSDPRTIYFTDSQEKMYNQVSISYGGDHFENGGVEKYFICKKNLPVARIECINDGCWATGMGPNTYSCGPPSEVNTIITLIRKVATSFEESNSNPYNGKLLAERYFKNINGDLYKTKESIYDYQSTDPSYFSPKPGTNPPISFVGRLLFGYDHTGVFCDGGLSGTMLKPLSSCYIGFYPINNPSFKLNSIVTKEYIEPIPMSFYRPLYFDINGFDIGNPPSPDAESTQVEEANELTYKKITTTQNYTYGSLKGLPTEITTTTSDVNIGLITKNIYPTQVSSLTDYPSCGVTACAKMVEQNMLSTPIQVEQYRGTELLSTQRTVYSSCYGNSNMVLPQIIQTAKAAGDLEDRAEFTEYDTKGNPTIVSMKDGTKIKYFYNALNQVVVKVENYSTALNIPATPDLADPCAFIKQYPSAMISVYKYDADTNQISSMVAPNCQTTNYVYDSLHQLKYTSEGYPYSTDPPHILQEFDHSYKTQN